MINEKKLIEDFKNTFSDSVLNQTFGFGKYTLLEAIEEMTERQPKTDWISCEERLPNDCEMVLVCLEQGYVLVGHHTGICGWYSQLGCFIYSDVIAWQPLPQPYKKEGAVDG